MASLPETSNFDSGVYQLETTDFVLGGATGISNLPQKALTNRTRWLYDHRVERNDLPTSSGSAQWIRLGTFTAPQGGQTIKLRLHLHGGITPAIAQDATVEIFFKTSNGVAVDGNGFGGDSFWYSIGKYAFAGPIKWKASAAGVAAASFDLYLSVPSFLDNSCYEVITSSGSSWLHAGQLGQTDPGAASSTVAIATQDFSVAGQTVWTAGNDGAGSGLDADMLDGQQGSFYAPIGSPVFTGTPTAPTAAGGDVSLKLANTSFVSNAVAAAVAPLATEVELNAAVAPLAPKASPALTGVPTAPTAAAGNSTTQLATTAFVQGAVGKVAKLVFQIPGSSVSAIREVNIAGLVYVAAGHYQVTFPGGLFPDNTYCVQLTAGSTDAKTGISYDASTKSATNLDIRVYDTTNASFHDFADEISLVASY